MQDKVLQFSQKQQLRSQALQALIVKTIADQGGWIRFSDFMQLALYEPQLGYYTQNDAIFGAHGDFVTAPELSSHLAYALAQENYALMTYYGLKHIIEWGAGTGKLAKQILDHCAKFNFFPSYHIVEIAEQLRNQQQHTLKNYAQVSWSEQLPSQLTHAVVIANEVLDAFACELWQLTAHGWHQQGVSNCNETLYFQLTPTTFTPPVLANLQLPLDYCTEVSPSHATWLSALSSQLKQALIWVIDYGFPAHEYYHWQRNHGTLICHCQHHTHTNPLWMPGCSDITAHVNFSALAQAAESYGLDLCGYTSQAHFLMNCEAWKAQASHHAWQTLTTESEMGELFKVMGLSKNLALTSSGDWFASRAFLRGDRSHTL